MKSDGGKENAENELHSNLQKLNELSDTKFNVKSSDNINASKVNHCLAIVYYLVLLNCF